MRNPKLVAICVCVTLLFCVGKAVPVFAALEEKSKIIRRLYSPETDDQSPLKSININKINLTSKLGVIGYAVSSYAPATVIQTSQDSDLVVNEIKPAAARIVPPELSGQPLVYPSPARSVLGTQIGYYLSDNTNVEVRIYDMAGNMVFLQNFYKGGQGGKVGYNLLDVNDSTFGMTMQAGVYFVLVLTEGKVIGKTKFAVVP